MNKIKKNWLSHFFSRFDKLWDKMGWLKPIVIITLQFLEFVQQYCKVWDRKHLMPRYGPVGSINFQPVYGFIFKLLDKFVEEENTSNRSIVIIKIKPWTVWKYILPNRFMVSLKIKPWTGWKFILPTRPCLE